MTALDAAKLLLAKALEDETLVVKTLADPDISDAIIGFHCQQACEKLLKALLAAMNIEYRVSHDVGELSILLKEAGETVPVDMRTLIRLNRFAVKIRAWVEKKLETLESQKE
jgi:HEPN domain-containing protein